MTKPIYAPDETPTTARDWSAVYRRLEAVQIALEQGVKPTLDQEKAILKTRAQTLARESLQEQAPQDHIEIVEFLLAYETYGIESSHIREILRLKELTPVPFTPPFVLGVINVRGEILSVVDIKKFFDLPEKGLTDLNTVIVLSDERTEFGVLADAVLGTRSIALAEVQPSLPTLTGIREEYLRGVTSERVVILDAQKLLSSGRMRVHEETAP